MTVKTTTKELKKKKKIWIPIFASKEFYNQQIGETYLEEPEKCLGRMVQLNLMMLTKDPKKQNFNIKLKINEVKSNQALTELIGYNIQVAQLKRITKKGKNKVEDSFVYKTKDNIDIVIKPVMLTKALTYKTTLQLIRKHSREFLKNYTKNKDFSQIMKDIIDNNLQKEIRNNIKKSYPIINCIIKDAHKLK